MSRDFKSEEGSRKSRKRAAEREEELEYRRTKLIEEGIVSVEIGLCTTQRTSDHLFENISVSEPQNIDVSTL